MHRAGLVLSAVALFFGVSPEAKAQFEQAVRSPDPVTRREAFQRLAASPYEDAEVNELLREGLIGGDEAGFRAAWDGYLAASSSDAEVRALRARAILQPAFFESTLLAAWQKAKFFGYALETSQGKGADAILMEIASWFPSPEPRLEGGTLDGAKLWEVAGYLSGTPKGIQRLREMLLDPSVAKRGGVRSWEYKNVARLLLLTAERSIIAMETLPDLVKAEFLPLNEVHEAVYRAWADGTDAQKEVAERTFDLLYSKTSFNGNGIADQFVRSVTVEERPTVMDNAMEAIERTGRPVEQVLQGPHAKRNGEMRPEDFVRPERIAETVRVTAGER